MNSYNYYFDKKNFELNNKYSLKIINQNIRNIQCFLDKEAFISIKHI